MRTRALIASAVVFVAALGGTLRATELARGPTWFGVVLFEGGETRLHPWPGVAVPIVLPPAFADWDCYIEQARIEAGAETRPITCNGRWGSVDTFVSCGPKQRTAQGMLRLRLPTAGGKGNSRKTESATIQLGCTYER